MNLSASIMLVNKAIRSVRVQYDPDILKNNAPDAVFMTFDTAISKDDLDFISTLGHGDPATIFDRSPRPAFEKFNRIA